MGKRELLLIVAFLIVGAVVYQATAPPAGPNERSWSFTGILEQVRREMRGNRASAQSSRTTTHELDSTVTEVRIVGSYGELTITGEDRENIEAVHRVTSNGYDEAEAKDLVEQTLSMLTVDRAGASLRLTSDYPRPGSQRAQLTLRVPRKLNVRIDQGSPRTTVASVATVELTVRGETSIKKIAGRATIGHHAGRLLIEDVGALKLNGRGSDITATKVRGDASFTLQSGELNARSIAGPIDVEAQGADVSFKDLQDAQGPLRVNAVGGSVKLEGLKGDARVDGRNTDIEIAMSKAAAVAVYSEGDERIEITAPPGGFVIDALVTQGRLTLADGLGDQVTVTSAGEDKEQRANGPVRGGGPTMTLRANRGDVTVRTRETTPPAVER